ncbi:hypothetical protein FRC12_013125, partial [Ceratobasidium sp. 428]
MPFGRRLATAQVRPTSARSFACAMAGDASCAGITSQYAPTFAPPSLDFTIRAPL